MNEKETKLLYFIQLMLPPAYIRVLSNQQLDIDNNELKHVNKLILLIYYCKVVGKNSKKL